MTVKRSLLAALVLLAFAFGSVSASDGTAVNSPAVRWSCAVPLLGDYEGAGNAPDVGEAVTYLYAGDKDMHEDYGADALFTMPLDGRHGWYDSTLRLGPYIEDNGFVQIEISRWERFNYKQHIAVSWSVPHGTVVQHKDTGLMLDDRVAHRLAIAVHGGRVDLRVDGREICSAPASSFVSPGSRKYFQVRSETSVVGRNSNARVSDVHLKRDSDRTPRPFASDCILHRHGIFWEYLDGGRFVARGAFYPNEATYFTGTDFSKPCRS
jgi:hypothetical protein